MLHRDLKSPNVLLGVQHSKVTAKIADFGLAVSLVTRTVIGRVVENPVWLAPEVMGMHLLFFFCFSYFPCLV